MSLGLGSSKAGGSHAAAFLVGVALPTALLFLLASDRLGEGLSNVSRSWGSVGTTQQLPAADAAAPTRDQEDADMIWFRNPFRHIALYADMSCSSDDFKPSRAPMAQPLNTGLYYMKSTNRTIEMVRYWRAARARFPGRHDQWVFVAIKRELVSKLQVSIEPLDTVYFGGFCEYHDDPERACAMHADCCIGLETGPAQAPCDGGDRRGPSTERGPMSENPQVAKCANS